jgi:CRISPR/Cas system-associated protein Csm6
LIGINSEAEKPEEKRAGTARIIYPAKRDETTRVSEQEAKLLLIRELEKQDDYYYSVEAPTGKCYKFQGQDVPIVDDDGRSGNIDICIYKANNVGFVREHLIEYKAHNVELDSFLKDFLKLGVEKSANVNYFVHIIETYDKGTIASLIEKYETAFNLIEKYKNTVKVCLCTLKPAKILFFDKTDYQNQLNSL